MPNKKDKRDSALVKAVLALDGYLAELERVGAKINSTDMTSDIDVGFIQKLMTRFTECGKGVSDEVANLSAHLREAQARTEAVAEGVSRQAELFSARRNEQNEKMEKFHFLGEKVRELNAAIGGVRGDRAKLKSLVPEFEAQLSLLVKELQDLRKSARDSRMKVLEKNAASLAQTLDAVRKKLNAV